MQLSVHDAGPGTVELEVLVEEERYARALNEVLDQVARTTQIPGFRKGKAPRAMVERAVDHAALRARAIERVLPGAYQEALKESGVQPLTDPRIEILSEDQDRELRFRMIVHKNPEITPGPTEGLKLTLFPTSVTDQDVDQAIESLRESRTTYTSEPEKAIEAGDIANVQVQVLLDGAPLEDAQDSLEIAVGQRLQTPAIDDELVGMKVGDEIDIPVSYPEDFKTEDLAGKETVWHVRIEDIRTRHVPELNDEFAQAEGDASNLEELRERTRTELERFASDQDRDALRNQALRMLLESSTVIYPHILLDQELESRQERIERTLRRNRHTIEDYAASEGLTVDQLRQQLHDQAEADVTEYLLIHRIAADKGIQIGPEEIDAEIEARGRARGSRPAIIELEKKDESRRQATAYDLLRGRVLDQVVEAAEIERQAVGGSSSAASEPEHADASESSSDSQGASEAPTQE